jgi:hypothetical protein
VKTTEGLFALLVGWCFIAATDPVVLVGCKEMREEGARPNTKLFLPLLLIGSTAGAGSGEFHVFRAARRRENARQSYMEETTAEVCMHPSVFSG